MRQEISRIAPLAAALLLGVAAVWAQAPEGQGAQGAGPVGQGPEGRGPYGRHDRMSRALDLNEAQQEKIREIREEQRPQREALHEKMSANREALHQLLESGTADANAVGELVLEGRKLHEEGRALFEAEQKKVRAILNPDQQKKFDALQERMKEHRRGPEGFGMPRQRGPRPGPGSSGRPGGSGTPDGPGSFGPSGIPGQPRSSPLGTQL
jgi:Spy/CpxP family protein refolding chaperone